ncbi:MAG TPA: PQQ-dependent sugar dehydrogenase [Thermoanaerobaculia bacterium]|jgi:hypothetical protein
MIRFVLVLLFALRASAAMLPGFRVEPIARVPGFVSSLAADSRGVIYASTTSGWIYRIDGAQATPVASLPTHEGGNGGLLGLALIDDRTAAVHYTTWAGAETDSRVLDDVISTVDLQSGAETVLHTFVCDVDFRPNGASSEHHGGNPTVAPDGAIFVGIGEYNGRVIAQLPGWNGGRIFRIARDGTATQWALGLRNPYDLAWDPQLARIVVTDNGPNAGDEIDIVPEHANLGWPHTYGHEAPMDGAVAPSYVFPSTVAPTGIQRLAGANALLRRGYLLGAFVTDALYYFEDVEHPEPVAIFDKLDEAVIDVTEMAGGEIVLATASFFGTSSIQRLHVPPRGDCNGDGLVNSSDLSALYLELRDGDPQPMTQAQGGTYVGSWGCDANGDGAISSADVLVLARSTGKRRAVRVR